MRGERDCSVQMSRWWLRTKKFLDLRPARARGLEDVLGRFRVQYDCLPNGIQSYAV